ncbi:MAG: YqjK-like family protein [Rhodocyclales bacterium]|nr:YqjK-like family protein [Rhodocyclales bacterium]
MNPAVLELALRKQRLQIQGETLRGDFARHADGLRPALAGADLAVDAGHWLRAHPQIVVAATVALLVAKPSRVWRWGRRAFVGWQAWRKVRGFIDQRLPSR